MEYFAGDHRFMAYFDDEQKAHAYSKARALENSIDLLPIISKYIHPGAELLELGIGPGVDFAHLSQDYHVSGIDVSHVFVRMVQEQFLDARIVCCSADDFQFQQVFSGIYSNKVMHNFDSSQLEQSFLLQAEHLEKDGIAVHTVWNGEGQDCFDGEPCYYYTVDSIYACAKKHFTVLETSRYSEFSKDDSLCVVLRKASIT